MLQNYRFYHKLLVYLFGVMVVLISTFALNLFFRNMKSFLKRKFMCCYFVLVRSYEVYFKLNFSYNSNMYYMSTTYMVFVINYDLKIMFSCVIFS